jgi:cytoskeletal protein CcmA (bactofilin family)
MICLMIFISAILWCAPTRAGTEFRIANFRAGANITVAEDEVISEELTVAGANVKVAGELKEGLNVFGANIKVSGNVQGELNAIGANIILSGEFRSKVGAGAANIVLDGIFEDNVEVEAAKITLTPTAVIKGNLNYASAILDRQEGAQVLGEIFQKETTAKKDEAEQWDRKDRKIAGTAHIIFWFLSLAALLVVGLIINGFFPRQTETVVALISDSPWTNIGVGFVFLVAVPVAIVASFITVIGIPAGIIAGLIYGGVLYISRIYIGVWIGRKIIGYFKKSKINTFLWPFVLGIAVIALIGLIPFLGWLFKLFCLLISLGALWLAAWRAIHSRR